MRNNWPDLTNVASQTMRRWTLLCCCAAALGSTSARAIAQESTEAVAAARDALQKSSDYPWYDQSQDAVRRIELDTSQNHQPTPRPGPSSSLDASWLQWLAWAGFAALIFVIIALLIRAALARRHVSAAAEVKPEHDESRRARIESLPFPVRKDSDLLAEADRLRRAGRYAEAILYLFSHQLVELDRRQRIRLTRGKTNRQYLRELGRRSPLRGILEETMVAFEDVFFGSHGLEAGRFEHCWSRLNEFDQLAQETPA